MGRRSSMRGADPLTRARKSSEAEVDFTNLIDCVLLLLIFFMVSEAINSMKKLDFPEAKITQDVDPKNASLVTILEPKATTDPPSYVLGDKGDATTDIDDVKRFLEDNARDGKLTVLVRAEKKVLHREVLAVARLISDVEGARLAVAVEEPR